MARWRTNSFRTDGLPEGGIHELTKDKTVIAASRLSTTPSRFCSPTADVSSNAVRTANSSPSAAATRACGTSARGRNGWRLDSVTA